MLATQTHGAVRPSNPFTLVHSRSGRALQAAPPLWRLVSSRWPPVLQCLRSLKASLLALVLALGATPICAQMAGDGQPWTHADADGGNWGITCNTMSAIECSNQEVANVCALFPTNDTFCGATTVSCGYVSLAADLCTLSNGATVGVNNAASGGSFVSTHPQATADCGCDSNNNNKVGHPISPANGNVSDEQLDIPAQSSSPQSGFTRFYNSADTGSTDLGVGWRHSFSRQIIPNVSPDPFQP
jgi:hypothetical protein